MWMKVKPLVNQCPWERCIASLRVRGCGRSSLGTGATDIDTIVLSNYPWLDSTEPKTLGDEAARLATSSVRAPWSFAFILYFRLLEKLNACWFSLNRAVPRYHFAGIYDGVVLLPINFCDTIQISFRLPEELILDAVQKFLWIVLLDSCLYHRASVVLIRLCYIYVRRYFSSRLFSGFISTTELPAENLTGQRMSVLCSCLWVGRNRHQFACFCLRSSIGLLELNFWNPITRELHDRACWQKKMPELSMSALRSCTLNIYFF